MQGSISVVVLVFQFLVVPQINVPGVACADCATEAAALGQAQANYDAAYSAYEDALDDYTNDPNATTAAALGQAEAILDAAEGALYDALFAWQMCVNGGPPPEEPPAYEIDRLASTTVSILER